MDVDGLTTIGLTWYSEIRYRKPDGARKAANDLANRINNFLEQEARFLSVRVSPFHFYELLVYHTGKAYKYDSFIKHFENDLPVTLWILDFALGKHNIDDFNGYCFTDKQKKLVQSFVEIVLIAEYGRGYTDSKETLIDYLEDVADSEDSWSNLKLRYTPALTYREDERTYLEENPDFLN